MMSGLSSAQSSEMMVIFCYVGKAISGHVNQQKGV